MTTNKNYVECEICFKRFYEKGQKYKPIYYLNAHRKTCARKLPKKRRAWIKEYVENCDSLIELNRIVDYIQNPDDYLPQVPTKDMCPVVPSPTPSASTSSDLDEWEYEKITYFVDNKNRVCDEYGNAIGTRVKEEVTDEYRLEYE